MNITYKKDILQNRFEKSINSDIEIFEIVQLLQEEYFYDISVPILCYRRKKNYEHLDSV